MCRPSAHGSKYKRSWRKGESRIRPWVNGRELPRFVVNQSGARFGGGIDETSCIGPVEALQLSVSPQSRGCVMTAFLFHVAGEFG